jgi:hypothetical protein
MSKLFKQLMKKKYDKQFIEYDIYKHTSYYKKYISSKYYKHDENKLYFLYCDKSNHKTFAYKEYNLFKEYVKKQKIPTTKINRFSKIKRVKLLF